MSVYQTFCVVPRFLLKRVGHIWTQEWQRKLRGRDAGPVGSALGETEKICWRRGLGDAENGMLLAPRSEVNRTKQDIDDM